MCTLALNFEMLAERIPGARMVAFGQGGELIELEQPDRYAAELRSFLQEHQTA